jgi:hypothetical protein
MSVGRATYRPRNSSLVEEGRDQSLRVLRNGAGSPGDRALSHVAVCLVAQIFDRIRSTRPARPPDDFLWRGCNTSRQNFAGKSKMLNPYADAHVCRFTILLFFSKVVSGKSFQQSLSSLPFVALGNEAEIQR